MEFFLDKRTLNVNEHNLCILSSINIYIYFYNF